MSRGEYIFNLDNDDLFFNNILIDFTFSKAKTQNLDVVHYKTIIIYNYTTEIQRMSDIFTILYPNEFYLEQPELSLWMIKYKNRYVVHNNMIWDKCIKTSIYKKAVNLMKFDRFSKFVSWAEDTSINFIIMNLANNFKYVFKYGIVHYKGKNTASNTQSKDTKIFGEIFFLDILYNIINDSLYQENLDFSSFETKYKVLAIYYTDYVINKTDIIDRNSLIDKQVKLAKNHGIYGFGIVYNWINNKTYNEAIFNLLTQIDQTKFPFFIILNCDSKDNNQNNIFLIYLY
jgi:hypothetical protein